MKTITHQRICIKDSETKFVIIANIKNTIFLCFLFLFLFIGIKANVFGQAETEFTFTFKENVTDYPYKGDNLTSDADWYDQWGTFKQNCTSVALWKINVFLGANYSGEYQYSSKREKVATASFDAKVEHNNSFPIFFGNYDFVNKKDIPIGNAKDWEINAVNWNISGIFVKVTKTQPTEIKSNWLIIAQYEEKYGSGIDPINGHVAIITSFGKNGRVNVVDNGKNYVEHDLGAPSNFIILSKTPFDDSNSGTGGNTQISNNKCVKALVDLNTREKIGGSAITITKETKGQILAGPQDIKLTGNKNIYRSYQIQWDNGTIGWSAYARIDNGVEILENNFEIFDCSTVYSNTSIISSTQYNRSILIESDKIDIFFKTCTNLQFESKALVKFNNGNAIEYSLIDQKNGDWKIVDVLIPSPENGAVTQNTKIEIKLSTANNEEVVNINAFHVKKFEDMDLSNSSIPSHELRAFGIIHGNGTSFFPNNNVRLGQLIKFIVNTKRSKEKVETLVELIKCYEVFSKKINSIVKLSLFKNEEKICTDESNTCTMVYENVDFTKSFAENNTVLNYFCTRETTIKLLIDFLEYTSSKTEYPFSKDDNPDALISKKQIIIAYENGIIRGSCDNKGSDGKIKFEPYDIVKRSHVSSIVNRVRTITVAKPFLCTEVAFSTDVHLETDCKNAIKKQISLQPNSTLKKGMDFSNLNISWYCSIGVIELTNDNSIINWHAPDNITNAISANLTAYISDNNDNIFAQTVNFSYDPNLLNDNSCEEFYKLPEYHVYEGGNIIETITKANANGGGRVYVHEGYYKTSGIKIYNNIYLIAKGKVTIETDGKNNDLITFENVINGGVKGFILKNSKKSIFNIVGQGNAGLIVDNYIVNEIDKSQPAFELGGNACTKFYRNTVISDYAAKFHGGAPGIITDNIFIGKVDFAGNPLDLYENNLVLGDVKANPNMIEMVNNNTIKADPNLDESMNSTLYPDLGANGSIDDCVFAEYTSKIVVPDSENKITLKKAYTSQSEYSVIANRDMSINFCTIETKPLYQISFMSTLPQGEYTVNLPGIVSGTCRIDSLYQNTWGVISSGSNTFKATASMLKNKTYAISGTPNYSNIDEIWIDLTKTDSTNTFLIIYPNPAKDNVKVQLDKDDTYKIQISSIEGKNSSISLENTGKEFELNISSLNAGYYLMSVQSLTRKDFVKSAKILIVK